MMFRIYYIILYHRDDFGCYYRNTTFQYLYSLRRERDNTRIEYIYYIISTGKGAIVIAFDSYAVLFVMLVLASRFTRAILPTCTNNASQITSSHCCSNDGSKCIQSQSKSKYPKYGCERCGVL